jgi:hypothetical protein
MTNRTFDDALVARLGTHLGSVVKDLMTPIYKRLEDLEARQRGIGTRTVTSALEHPDDPGSLILVYDDGSTYGPIPFRVGEPLARWPDVEGRA